MIRYALLIIVLLTLTPMVDQNVVVLTFEEIFGGDISIYGVEIIRNETTFNMTIEGTYNASIILYCNNSDAENYVKITVWINNESKEAIFEKSPIKLSLEVYINKTNLISLEIYKLGTGFFSILRNSTITLRKINQANQPENNSNQKSEMMGIIAILSLLIPIMIRVIQVKKKKRGV